MTKQEIVLAIYKVRSDSEPAYEALRNADMALVRTLQDACGLGGHIWEAPSPFDDGRRCCVCHHYEPS
jgi:hypothetical protein